MSHKKTKNDCVAIKTQNLFGKETQILYNEYKPAEENQGFIKY